MNTVYLLCGPGWRGWKMGRYKRVVRQANALEGGIKDLSEEGLKGKLQELRTRAQVRPVRELTAAALAMGREVSRRTLGLRHYDVQLMGTLALFEGYIAEMETGEGKTLMAPLAALLHQLEKGRGCTHIVTANEYLAARDAEWMGPLCEGLGMSVGLIVPGQPPAMRARMYHKDVVYATAKELVFDSLREPARRREQNVVEAILRPKDELVFDPTYDFAIVDEVDSVLVDQARSPFSIGDMSKISPRLELYKKAEEVAGQLTRGAHYRLMQDDQKMELKDEGKAEARRRAGQVLRLLPGGHVWERYVVCALAARYLYKKDVHYVVREGKVVMVDETTGRLMPGRQFPEGIHQAIEVHNGINPSLELKGAVQTTFQTFFRKYKKLAGMTGTAREAGWEFQSVYDLAVVVIPPNRPSQREVHPDRIYRSMKRKLAALVDEVERVHYTGRPVLIGTGSVQVSERIGEMLGERGLEHEILNAKNHAREAAIIAEAGQEGKITVITNMAGRGVDIKLGEGVAGRGGMYLIGTDRLHYRRLDNQLMGRVGRQGDPADCQFFLSLQDDLMRYADRKKISRLRRKTRGQRHEPIGSSEADTLFRKVQKHISKVTSKQRHLMYQGEKQREKLREMGMWEDWMDAR